MQMIRFSDGARVMTAVTTSITDLIIGEKKQTTRME